MPSVLTTHSIKRQRDKEKNSARCWLCLLLAMMVSQVYAYVQTHQIVYIRCIQLLCISDIPQSCEKIKTLTLIGYTMYMLCSILVISNN